MAQVVQRASLHTCMVICVLRVLFVSLHLSPFLLFSVAPLPALPDALLRCPQEVHVPKPAQLPLGDRGQ